MITGSKYEENECLGAAAMRREPARALHRKIGKKWGAKSEKMYRQKEIKEVTVEEFGLKWQGKLAADNRWVILVLSGLNRDTV
jgi:hypothetical protein